MTEDAPADDREHRREVILARSPRPRPGRQAVLRRSLVVVYARAVRMELEADE